MGVFKPRLSVRKIIAIGLTYLTSRELQNAVPRRRVPFHGAPEPGIDIGTTFGDDTEFQGATGIAGLDDATAFQKFLDFFWIAVAAAGHDSDAFVRTGTNANFPGR